MNDLKELEDSILKAIEEIKDGKSTPKKTGIGKMLANMQEACYDTHTRLLQEYVPVAHNFFGGGVRPAVVKVTSSTEQKLELIEKNLSFEETDFDDDGNLLPDVREKIIEDAAAHIEGKKKKKKVKVEPKIVSDTDEPKVRDRSGYVFNGITYGKGPLVLAVIKYHVESNPTITYDKLKQVFPDELLKSYGIFKRIEVAREASIKRKRYFLKDEQLVDMTDCQIAICNQFTSDNIVLFVAKAREVGYEIKENV